MGKVYHFEKVQINLLINYLPHHILLWSWLGDPLILSSSHLSICYKWKLKFLPCLMGYNAFCLSVSLFYLLYLTFLVNTFYSNLYYSPMSNNKFHIVVYEKDCCLYITIIALVINLLVGVNLVLPHELCMTQSEHLLGMQSSRLSFSVHS
jgi:hypothetical protein